MARIDRDTMNIKSIATAILVGGRSRRMGRDKALVPFNGRPLVEYAIDAAASRGRSVSLVLHPEQLAAGRYEQLARRRGLSLVIDEYDHQGPLGGLATALGQTDLAALVLLPCDMPFLTGELLDRLIEVHGRNAPSGVEITIPADRDGRPQPLVGVYAPAVRALARQMIEEGERRFGLLPARRPTTVVDFSEIADLPGHDRFFTNLNYPGDLPGDFN